MAPRNHNFKLALLEHSHVAPMVEWREAIVTNASLLKPPTIALNIRPQSAPVVVADGKLCPVLVNINDLCIRNLRPDEILVEVVSGEPLPSELWSLR